MDSKGYDDIDYNALVDTAGRIYEGRTGIWLTVGSHCLGHNTVGIGVCYIGDASTPLTPAARTAIRWLYDEANRRRRAAGVAGALAAHPHSRFVQTSCPGDQLRAWVGQGMPAPAGTTRGHLMFCQKGDTSPAVKAMQLMIIAVGGSVGGSGADGEYGPATVAGLAPITGDDGTVYGPNQYIMLHSRVFRGAAGARGPEGPAGPAGKTPTRILITGEVSAYESAP